MRVAIVSKTFVAETAQRQLEWLARQPGLDVTLITPPEWKSDDGRTLRFTPQFTQGYQVHELPVMFNGHYHFYVYRGLRQALRDLAPQIVHIDEEPYNPAGAQAQQIASGLHIPTVFVAWQNIYRAYPLPFARLEHYNYRRTAYIIAGNAGAADVVRRKGYKGPLSVFSVHGVDPNIYFPLPRRERRVYDDRFIIGYLGRLVLYKGTGQLIEAMVGLPEYCRLRFVGSGPDEAELRRLAAERGVAAQVEFRPAVPTSDVPQTLAEMDTLAAPSLTQPNWVEQFGRVLIEGMACGLPVVGSDSGEIPHVVGDAGIIVPEGDVAALRNALGTLATQPALRAQLGERGRARVLEHYTQEQVARNLVAVYERALSSKR